MTPDDLERLRDKLRRLLAGTTSVFSAGAPNRILARPLPEPAALEFEARHGVRLPADYRAFLTHIADGGAGPHQGLYSLAKATEENPWLELGPLAGEFHPADEPGEPEPAANGVVYARLPDGVLALAHEGCDRWSLLVLGGPERGTVWTFAETAGGMHPTGQTFLQWYEAWLDGALEAQQVEADELERMRNAWLAQPAHDGAHTIDLALRLARHRRFAEADELLRAAIASGHEPDGPTRDHLLTLVEAVRDAAAQVAAAEWLNAGPVRLTAAEQCRLLMALAAALVDSDRAADVVDLLEALFRSPLAEDLGLRREEARYHYVRALFPLGRHLDALATLDPTSEAPLEHNLIGACLTELGRLDEALAAYRRSDELAGGWIVPNDNIGYVHFLLGDLDEADRIHRACLAEDPDYPHSHYNLALVHAARGELDEAMKRFERAVALGYSVADIRRDPHVAPLRATEVYRRLIGPRRDDA